MTNWISVTEAAQLFDYHPDHLRELIRAGKINAQKFADVWQIDQASLANYIQQARKKSEKTGRKKSS